MLGMTARVKRTFDIVFATILIIFLIPVGGAAVILIAALDGLPIFHTQDRVTVGGRRFRIWKFRTMRRDAEPDDRPVWPRPDDRRITRLGRVLRRLWIDELPQLINVLRGDLSLVGPRPERPEFVKEFTRALPKYTHRHRVRAGMTGWAQAMGYVGNTSVRKRLACDLEYVRRCSPGFDVCVIALTLCQFMKRHRRPRFDFVPGTGQAPP